MNKRIRKKQEKQRKQLEMKWLLDMAVQYRRTSSFELLKRYLEERAYDDEEI